MPLTAACVTSYWPVTLSEFAVICSILQRLPEAMWFCGSPLLWCNVCTVCSLRGLWLHPSLSVVPSSPQRFLVWALSPDGSGLVFCLPFWSWPRHRPPPSQLPALTGLTVVSPASPFPPLHYHHHHYHHHPSPCQRPGMSCSKESV